MNILIKNMEMPSSCDRCWALDDYGDYPRCRITEEQRGYNFPIREKRMDKCPLVLIPSYGRWIKKDIWSEGVGMGESYGYYYECSECGCRIQGDYNKCGYNFCPNCGADMREES